MSSSASGSKKKREINLFDDSQKLSNDQKLFLKGWGLTAHHIVPHSLLQKALAKLSAKQRDDILQKSLPKRITASMMHNCGLTYFGYLVVCWS